MKNEIIFLLVSLSLVANAQESPYQQTHSQESFVSCAPEYIQWVITYEYFPEEDGKAYSKSTQTAKEEGNRIAKVVATKTKNIISQITITNSGERLESWMVSNTQFNKNSESAGFFETSLEKGAMDYLPIENGDFPEFSWVGKGTFIGVEQWNGRTVLAFHQKSDAFSRADSLILKIALIDEKSHLPVMLQTLEERMVYKFTDLPFKMQTVPPPVLAMLEAKERRRKIISAPIPRPY